VRVVLIADPPHGNRVEKELRALGHEVECVRDVGGDARRAIHPGTEWVILMCLHSERHLIPEKAREVGARLVWSQVGWSHCRRALEQAGFPFVAPEQPDMFDAEPEPVAALAPVQPAPLRSPFVFEGSAVEVLIENGEPLFLASDVCERCGIANTRDAMTRLDDDEKAKKIQPSVQPTGVAPPLARWYVTEAGLYSLVNGSRTPESKRFRRWVNHDVLPSIRRTGSYLAQPEPESEDALVLRAFGVLQGRVKVLQAENTFLTAANKDLVRAKEEAAPAVDFYMRFANAEGLTGLRDAGRIFTGHPDKWIDSLIGKYLFRAAGVLVPYSQYGDGTQGLFTVKLDTINDKVRRRTFLTAKGMQYFARLLHPEAA
jgi:anti-repressor protein